MNNVLCGDAAKVMREALEPGSVHMCVTSPPYYGLRDYGTAKWIGGDPKCKHLCGGQVPQTKCNKESLTTGVRPGCDASRCRKCGARRQDSQIGLERTVDEYVQHIVEVMREVKRVLRDDGTLWLVLGDSYAVRPQNRSDGYLKRTGGNTGLNSRYARTHERTGMCLAAKNLIGVPWRVAFAMQSDGWVLRSDIVWEKPNTLPEAVVDRPTKNHEFVFLFAKQQKYFYDIDAIREPHESRNGLVGGTWEERKRNGSPLRYGFNSAAQAADYMGQHPNGRNRRSVWDVPTEAFSGAHFAVFPRKLIVPCIKAGTSEKGCCAKCGAPWRRVTRTEYKKHPKWFGGKQGARHSRGNAGVSYNEPVSTVTLGWRPSCSCRAGDPVHCTVLDPFAGSGVTGVVAQYLGRDSVLIELNSKYIALIRRRLSGGWDYKMPKEQLVPRQEVFFR